MGRLPPLLGLVALGIYLLLAGPTFYWLDSSEFVAASWSLGIAHPPGHPLASLLGRLACYLPFGTLAFRTTLACALEAAAATTCVALIARAAIARLGAGSSEAPRALTHHLPVAVASLSAGLSYAIVFQAVRTEVYALNLVLVAAATACLLAWDARSDRRYLFAAALCAGLALCNHHLLALLALAPAGLFVVLRRPATGFGRVLLGVVLAGLLGLGTLTYLPLRARHAPEVSWGLPNTLERFGWVVSARIFQKSVRRAAQESAEHRLAGAAFAVLGGLGPVGAIMGLAGLYLLVRRRSSRRTGLLLAGLVGSNLLSIYLVGFDPLNPDAHGYLSVAVALLAPALAVFLHALATGAARLAPRAGPALVSVFGCALPLYQAWAHLPASDLRQHWAAEETGRALLEVPPGSLVVTSYFENVFNLWALRATADLRPDVGLLHRSFLGQPGHLELLAAREPELLPLARSWPRPDAVRADDLAALARTRPVLVEHDFNLDPAITARLAPAGMLLRFDGTLAPRTVQSHLAAIQRWTTALGSLEELETRRAATWAHYHLLRYACLRRLPALVELHLAAAQTLAPRSQEIATLARQCRP
ncbi:MAG: DUF2723 domain-containing protein [Deltaproteobacteria bacterium]|nr:DUF2723 domain-containing protein [Deltaproteobacteria bacterium]